MGSAGFCPRTSRLNLAGCEMAECPALIAQMHLQRIETVADEYFAVEVDVTALTSRVQGAEWARSARGRGDLPARSRTIEFSHQADQRTDEY